MITEEENRLICEVEGPAPMGHNAVTGFRRLCRRRSRPTAACACVCLENLVAFRDSNGDVGLIDEFCPHRGPRSILAGTKIAPAVPLSRLEV